jgi:hypothetical protein
VVTWILEEEQEIQDKNRTKACYHERGILFISRRQTKEDEDCDQTRRN